jgi:hypothetical protein
VGVLECEPLSGKVAYNRREMSLGGVSERRYHTPSGQQALDRRATCLSPPLPDYQGEFFHPCWGVLRFHGRWDISLGDSMIWIFCTQGECPCDGSKPPDFGLVSVFSEFSLQKRQKSLAPRGWFARLPPTALFADFCTTQL